MLRKWGESKPKGKERLAVCADGETSVDPATPNSDGGYESLAVPNWTREFKRKCRYSLILYFFCHGHMAFCDDCYRASHVWNLSLFEKLSWQKKWEVESETSNFMVQINEFGHFCRQMVLLFIRCPNKQMIIVETHILLSSSSYVLLNTLQKAGIRVACSRLKGETHVAPTSG